MDKPNEASPSGGGGTQIMVFRPTWEEFKDFNNYIKVIEAAGAHKAGLAKIIPPPEWKPRKDGYDMSNIGEMEIPAPISQVVQGKQGVYQQFNIVKKQMKVREFRKMAHSAKYVTPVHFDYDDLERKYWRNIAYVAPIYGADVPGSLTDPDVAEWNINKLGSILDFVNEDYGISIDGVNTAYLYFGMWKSSFAWHTEDMDLYSINYLHFGEPKSWYSVPPAYGHRLERLANGFFSGNLKECPAYLRHKMTVLSPAVLKHHGIPYNKIVQEAGEFMITFPFGYHAGFNHGWNCAESTNFASPRWVEYGKRATQCACRPDMVKISMDTFVKRFQPERYHLWVKGKDYGSHPEDPAKRISAAPPPSRDEILCNKNHTQLPDSYVEPRPLSKKASKRHLVHKALDLEGHSLMEDDDGQCSSAGHPTKSEEDDSDTVNDEETFEMMKDVLYKAGELESDALEDWETNDEPKSKKPKKLLVTANKSADVQQHKKNTTNAAKKNGGEKEAPPATRTPSKAANHQRVGPVKRAVPRLRVPTPEPVVKEQGDSDDGDLDWEKGEAGPAHWNGASWARPSVNLLPGFRIPKKLQQLREQAESAGRETVAVRGWTEEENSASRVLLDLGCGDREPSPPIAPNTCPRPLRNPPTLARDLHQSEAAHQLVSCHGGGGGEHGSSSPSLPTAGPSSYDDIEPLQEQSNKMSRSRKQKSPRRQTAVPVRSSPPCDELIALWKVQDRWTVEQEAEFNWLSSAQQSAPACCVCALLSTAAYEQVAPTAQPCTSLAVLVPEELFTRSPTNHLVPTSSKLLRCSSCRVCVHNRCYGGEGVDDGVPSSDTLSHGWRCQKCVRHEQESICCLCLKRSGGAFKPTTDGRWAHVVCALATPDVRFGQPALRQPVDVGGVPNDALTLDCVFCCESLLPGGKTFTRSIGYFDRTVCLPCANGCGRSFHPTCGLVHGVRFQLSNNASGQISAVCCSYSPSPASCSSSAAGKTGRKTTSTVAGTVAVLLIGSPVYAKHPSDGKYYLAEVTDNKQTVTYYCVDFSDGSQSSDTYPEDIRNYDCVKDGPPPMGAAIDVQWTDGNSYAATFRGQIHRLVYRVRFVHDGAIVTGERSELYQPEEDGQMPKRVRDYLGTHSY